MDGGVLLERAGIPAVSLCTQPFRVTGEAMATAYGAPDFEFVTVPHPLASLDLDGIRAKIAAAVPQMLRILGVSDVDGEGDRS